MNATILQYVGYFICGLLGLCISTLLIIRSLTQKAQAAKLKFPIGQYFKLDWFTPVGSIITIVLALFMVDVTLKWNPVLINWLKPLFATIGYFGSDLATRLFSVANSWLNKAVADKVSVADDIRGTAGTLTPAFPVKPVPSTPPPNQTP